MEPTTIEIIKIIILALLGLWESLSRLIPSTKTWSIIGLVLKILVKISDTLNVKKSKKNDKE